MSMTEWFSMPMMARPKVEALLSDRVKQFWKYENNPAF
jgi:hypothetical protein